MAEDHLDYYDCHDDNDYYDYYTLPRKGPGLTNLFPSCAAKEGEYRKNESSGVHFHNAFNNTTKYNTRLTITSATRGDQMSPMSPLTRMALGPL